jgi:hypothetical protein
MIFRGVSPNSIKVLLLLVATFLISSCATMQRGYQAAGKSDEAALENIDAMQAVEIANKWKWTKKDVTTSIDSREVIFEFPDGKVKRIALPEDKMYIAIAPYIKRTHT